MSLLNLRKLLRESFRDPPRLFVTDESVIWYNGRMVVIDDPHLIEFFGEYLLKEALPKKDPQH